MKKHIIWDRTNIGENYPGITAPLTYSFIKDAYAHVYSNFLKLIGVPAAERKKRSNLMYNMLGYIQGRVYYNLRCWYEFLHILPFYRHNKEFFEVMLNPVQPIQNSVPGAAGLFSRLRTGVIFVIQLIFYTRIKSRFEKQFTRLYSEATTHPLTSLDNRALVTLFQSTEQKFFSIWAITIINDFKLMIANGLLHRFAGRYPDKKETLLQEAYHASHRPHSMEPLYNLQKLARSIVQNPDFARLFTSDPETIFIQLKTPQYRELASQIDKYLAAYGDRCANELKLEEPKFREKPSLLIALLKQYCAQPPSKKTPGKKTPYNTPYPHPSPYILSPEKNHQG